MNEPKQYGVTVGLTRGASELIETNTALLEGVPSGGKVGVAYTFPTANFQDQRRAVQYRAYYLEIYRAKDIVPDGNLNGATITVRDRDGNFILEDVPLWRLSVQTLKDTTGIIRPLLFTPRFVDWRQSFIRLVVANVAVYPLDIVYEPANV